jgi:hypothetical protein
MVHFIKKRLQVFVSSTYLDLKEERQAAVKAILEAGHIPAGMELFTSGDEGQMEVIKQWIESSDVYLLILGGRYGSLEPTSGKSYTHLEYEYAIEIEKPLFTCVMKDEYLEEKIKNPNVNSKDIREQDNQDKFRDFKKLVMSKMVFQCNSFLGIENSILKKMNELGRDDQLVGWIRSNESTGSTVLSEEVARLSKENHELREQLKINKLQEKSSGLFINGISFSEITKILSKIILSIEDFTRLTSLIEKRLAERIIHRGRDTFYTDKLINLISSGELSNALDLIYLLSDKLLTKLKDADDKEKISLEDFYGGKVRSHVSSGLSDEEFESVCMIAIFTIPKLNILFEFDILALSKEGVIISAVGKDVVKCIKAHKAKVAFLSENPNFDN